MTLKKGSFKEMGQRSITYKKKLQSFIKVRFPSQIFFTELKVLLDQLQNFSPFPMCTCGKCVCNVNQRLVDLQAKESKMKFLIGLNKSFTQVKTHILLMDPLQPTNTKNIQSKIMQVIL